MKTLRCFCLTLFISLFTLTLFAQNNQFAVVDYMRVPEGGTSAYMEVEQKVWKPMHQEWANQGKILGWYLYQVPYPGGTDAEYQYVTVRIYSNMAQLENPMSDMDAIFKKVHPGKKMDDVGPKTLASRDLVKSYGFYGWEAFGDPNLTEPAKILQIVKFKIPMDKWEAYQEMETNFYHPTHKAEIKAGTRAGWSGWQLVRPMSTTGEYQFVAVDSYKDWKQYTSQNPEGLYEKVLSKNELEMRDKMFGNIVEGMSTEEWRLIDYVEAPVSATSSNN
jgi:hypothetical protein